MDRRRTLIEEQEGAGIGGEHPRGIDSLTRDNPPAAVPPISLPESPRAMMVDLLVKL